MMSSSFPAFLLPIAAIVGSFDMVSMIWLAALRNCSHLTLPSTVALETAGIGRHD
jgi:hypothetical protein